MYKEDLADLQHRLGRAESELRALADADARCALQLKAQVELLSVLADQLIKIVEFVGPERRQAGAMF